jgi:leader peptidase (prepilin peptidase) / N-methyltransferase
MAAAAEIGLTAALGGVIGSLLGARASPRHPAVELMTASAFAIVVAVRGFDARLLLELPFAAALVALAAIDLEHKLLPDRIVYPLALWGLLGTALVEDGSLVERLIAGAGAFLLLFLAALVRPGGMGMGDVKLTGAMGLYLGPAVIPALLVAFLTGTLAGVVIILREGATARSRTVPFGVFLALGGLVGLLAGADLIELYKDAFLAG